MIFQEGLIRNRQHDARTNWIQIWEIAFWHDLLRTRRFSPNVEGEKNSVVALNTCRYFHPFQDLSSRKEAETRYLEVNLMLYAGLVLY